MAHAGYELRLVLARQFELAVLVLDFLEQPHVLNRDHALVGEGRGKLDLPIGEPSHRAAYQDNYANRDSFTQQRDPEFSAGTNSSHGLDQFEVRVVEDIRNVDDIASESRSSGDRTLSRCKPHFGHELMEVRRQ